MKKLFKIFILFLCINTSLLVISEKVEAQSVSFQVFYDDLSPYGSWFESPDYGYVWRPQLSGFTPYSTNGYWVLTDMGWTWVSDYSWGWAPFHYGRWYNDPFYGYVWVPGYEWGPGWVTWRRSNDYYGWAPIGPGISLGVAYSNGYNVPYNNWNFVSCNNFGRRDIHNYYIDRSKNVTIINNTTVINTMKVDNTRKSTFNTGPDRMEVQKKVGKTINPVAIVDEKKPAQRVTKNSVQLYRPVVENNSNAATKPAPAKVTPLNEVKAQPNTRPGKNADAINERRAKQVPLEADAVKPAAGKQPVKQNNNQPAREPQQPVKKRPVRDEQPAQPVKQAPVQQPNKVENNIEPDKQEQPVRQSRDEQPTQPVKPQREPERPPQQQPEPRQDQPVREQRVQPQQPREDQPVREQRVQPQQPRQDQPVREQRVQPQQRSQPQQRPPATAPRQRKGGS